jgi:hypothetical protein
MLSICCKISVWKPKLTSFKSLLIQPSGFVRRTSFAAVKFGQSGPQVCSPVSARTYREDFGSVSFNALYRADYSAGVCMLKLYVVHSAGTTAAPKSKSASAY